MLGKESQLIKIQMFKTSIKFEHFCALVLVLKLVSTAKAKSGDTEWTKEVFIRLC